MAIETHGSHFAGIWDIIIPSPVGKQFVTLNIEERHGAVLGTATRESETVPFLTAIADGNVLRWSQDVTSPFRMNIKFEVTFTGDELVGTAKPSIFPAAKVSGHRRR